MSALEGLNDWIESHQSLVIAVGIPVLSVLSAAFVAWLTNRASLRSQRKERELHALSKLADFRFAEMMSVRDDLAEILTIAFHPLNTKKLVELFRISRRVLLSLDFRDKTSQQFLESMNKVLSTLTEAPDDQRFDSILDLQMSAQLVVSEAKIILEHELRSIDRISSLRQ